MKNLDEIPTRPPTSKPATEPATEPEVETKSIKATEAKNKRKIPSLKLREEF